MTSIRSPFPPLVLEDALAAATGIARSWERALVSPRFTIAGVADGPERRLLANLRCLAVRDPAVAEGLLLPALEDDGDDSRAFVAALALLEAGSDAVHSLLARLAAPGIAAPVLRALALTGNRSVEAELRSLVGKERNPARLAMVLGVLAFRRADAGVDLRALVEGAPEVAAASLWVAHGCAPAMFACNLAESMLESADPLVRDVAIEVGIIRGSKPALNAARDVVDSGVATSGVALLALASSGEQEDVLRLLRLSGVAEHRSAALYALGFTGSPQALEVCLAAMEEPKLARLAAESFSSVTGLRVEGPFAEAEEAKRPGGALVPPIDEEDLDADLVSGAETELPVPHTVAVKQWWTLNRARFSSGARYIEGKHFDGAGLLESFRNGPARRRHALGLELAVRTQGDWAVQVKQWARVQLSRQAATVRQPLMTPYGALLE